MAHTEREREPVSNPIRVAFQYDDGKIRFVEGKDTERWWDVMRRISEYIRQRPRAPQWPIDLDWKEVSLPEARDIFK